MLRFLMKTLLTLLIIAVVIAAVVVIFTSQTKFGRLPEGERQQRIEKSVFFKEGILENETPTKIGGDESKFSLMWKFLTAEKSDRLKPQENEIELVISNLKKLPKDQDCYVWFGHSSFLLQLDGKVILVDPVFYDASPVSFVNKPFPGTDIYKPSMMPDSIDYLVISHDHWDHLDYQTVTELRDRIGKVVCPLGVGEDFECWGFSADKLIELDCNESANDGGMVFRCLPTRHFSGRGLRSMRTQRASWLVEAPTRTVFYSGDGGYSDRFYRFGKQHPDIDLAIMENGQYNEQWNQIHTMPYQLGEEVRALNPKRFVTVHHSKYALARHAWDEPRRNEQQAAQESGIPLIVAKIGEIVKL